MNKKLSELVVQILKQNNIENIKKKEINIDSKKIENKKNRETKKKNIVDMLKNIVDDFSDGKKNKSWSKKKSIFDYDSLIPDFYKLNLSYGKNDFEGHYKNITNKYSKYKKTKTLSYSTLATQINTKNKNYALIIIKDKKDNNCDSFLFDKDKKMAVESYKWQSISWWHLMYELEGKIIF